MLPGRAAALAAALATGLSLGLDVRRVLLPSTSALIPEQQRQGYGIDCHIARHGPSPIDEEVKVTRVAHVTVMDHGVATNHHVSNGVGV